jgi:hypothetical protein
MKKIFCVGLFFILVLGVSAQCAITCYDFKSRTNFVEKYKKWALIATADDFINHNFEEVEQLAPSNNILKFKRNNVQEKIKYEIAKDDYFGYTLDGQLYRIYLNQDEGKPYYSDIQLAVLGHICLWGDIALTKPDKKDESISYSYCTGEFTIKVSLGISGEILKFTNENFGTIIGEIDESLKIEYLADLEKISGVKKSADVKVNKETLKLAIRYFEQVNNGDYK